MYSKKQSAIDSVRATINSSPFEAIRDHLWPLRALREEHRQGRWGEQRESVQKKIIIKGVEEIYIKKKEERSKRMEKMEEAEEDGERRRR